MSRLALGGRAGVIIPDGFLFGDGNKQKIKEKMLKEFNVHTIIRLPGSVFSPYTGIATNIIFFNREKAVGAPSGYNTKEIWFYRLDMPEGVKHFSKTKPMRFEHCQPIFDWWDNRREIEEYNADGEISGYKSKAFSPEELVAMNSNFDQCKFPKAEEEILSPSELLADYYNKRRTLDREIDKTLIEIQNLLEIPRLS